MNSFLYYKGGKYMNIYEELEWRGLIKDVSSEELKDKLNKGGMTF